MKAIKCLLVFQIILWTCVLFGQDQIEGQIDQQEAQLGDMFNRVHGDMTHLISGRQHVSWYPSIDGDPFWFPNAWIPGELQTWQYYYRDLPFKYDAYLDALVFLPDSFSLRRIWVNPELVRYFTIVNNTFVYFGLLEGEKEALEAANLKPGYFELIHNGSTRLVIKHTKYIKTTQSSSQVLGEFTKKSFVYLIREGNFFYVKSKRKLLRALKDHAGEVKAYLKKNEVKYRSISNERFIALLNYYDSL